jgi:hypothetical protein
MGQSHIWLCLSLRREAGFKLVSRNQVASVQGHCLGYSSDLASSSSWLNSATASGKTCINYGRRPTVYFSLCTGWHWHAHPRQPCSHTHSLIHISHTGPDASLCHAPTTWVTSSRPGQEAVRASTYTTHAWPEMRPLPSRDNQRSIPVPGWRRPSNICKKQEIDEDRQKTTKGARSSQACVRACASSAHVVIEGQRKRACRKIEEPQDSISSHQHTSQRHRASTGLCLASRLSTTPVRSDLGYGCCGLVLLPRLVSFNPPFLRDWIKDSTTMPLSSRQSYLLSPSRTFEMGGVSMCNDPATRGQLPLLSERLCLSISTLVRPCRLPQARNGDMPPRPG